MSKTAPNLSLGELTFLIGRKTPWVNKMDRMADSVKCHGENEAGGSGAAQSTSLKLMIFQVYQAAHLPGFSEFF